MLYATVRQRKIHVKTPSTVIQNGVGVDQLMLAMDEEWLEMDSIVCVFTTKYLVEEERTEKVEQEDGTEKEVTVKVMVEEQIVKEINHTFGNPILVPWENLKQNGTLSVSCTGYVNGEKVMTTMLPDSFWNIVQNGPVTGEKPMEATPTLYEQVIAAAGKAEKAAKTANDAAVEILEAKENGDFDGTDGVTPSIAVGNVSTGAPGGEAQVIRRGTLDNIVLDFVIPRGIPGTPGAPGVGIPGKPGLDGKDGKDGKDGAPGRDGVDGKDGSDANVTKKNIENALGFTPAPDFYTTERLPFKKSDGNDMTKPDLKAQDVWDMYNELLGIPHGENGTPVKDNTGKVVTYEYVISTGEYNTAGERGDRDTDIKKPKYLVLTGIHGREKAAIVSAYRFFKDVVERKNIPSQFREGAEFHIIPVGNPWGVDNTKQYNGTTKMVIVDDKKVEVGVDINRNFAYNWSNEVVGSRHPGDYAGSESETQAIMNWLKVNTDAELFIDFHNSSSDGKKEDGKTTNWVLNEVAMVVGLNTEKMKEVKRTALRGLDRVIPFWKYDQNYEAHNVDPDGNDVKEPVFSYSSFYDIPGASVYYATDKLGIPSITLECSSLQNEDAREYKDFTPETIAAGAEALGNILLEFYDSSEDENHGADGQFAVADGKGGIKWMKVHTAEEVGY